MGKKIKIYESEIKRATRRKLMESYLDEEFEMKDAYSKAKFRPSPGEKRLEKVFGQYGDDMDPAVIRYIRKNPDHILRRLSKLYPEIYMRHIPVQSNVDLEVYDDVSLDEVTQMNVYDDASNLTNDLETDKVKGGETVGVKDDKGVVRTITVNESTEDLFKRFLNKK
jgi:hypothetical protein